MCGGHHSRFSLVCRIMLHAYDAYKRHRRPAVCRPFVSETFWKAKPGVSDVDVQLHMRV